MPYTYNLDKHGEIWDATTVDSFVIGGAQYVRYAEYFKLLAHAEELKKDVEKLRKIAKQEADVIQILGGLKGWPAY